MKPDLSHLIQEVEGLIQSAQLRAARRKLQSVQKLATPARGQRLKLAQLARRSGLVSLALKLLNPVVRPSAKSPLRPTAEESAEYAGLLIRSGANTEATHILEALDPGEVPEAWLYRAYACITQWEYEAAIPFLKSYLEVEGLGLIQVVIGKLNLAAALVHERESSAAEPLLAELLELTARERLFQFHGNALELSAQNALFQKRWSDADSFLSRAERHLSEVGGLDHLFVQKWKAIRACLERKGERQALRDLEDVRREAVALGHSETVRDCDLYLAVSSKDEARLHAVYFGTPFESFRRRLLREAGPETRLPSHWDWSPSGKTSRTLDLALGVWQDGSPAFKPGQVLHRLLRALASDLYRPFRTAPLFEALYPGEFYNPFSSADRIYEAIRRLRLWAKEEGLSLAVTEKKGEYRLDPGTGLALRLSPQSRRLSPSLDRLKRVFADRPFSTREAALALGISERSASRVIRDALSDQTLASSGKSQFVRYRFAL
jgi:hypothetical protein